MKPQKTKKNQMREMKQVGLVVCTKRIKHFSSIYYFISFPTVLSFSHCEFVMKTNGKQECIAVGCVPSAAVAICCGRGGREGVPASGGAASGECLLRGVPALGVPTLGGARSGGWGWGACSRGVASQHALRQTPPVDRMIDTCKNITFATSLQTVKKLKNKHISIVNEVF